MKKVLFVCGNPPHKVHEAFAKSINADFFHYNDSSFKNKIKNIWKIPKNYDIYLSEGLFNYIVLAKIFRCIKKNALLINLFADPRIFQIIDKKKFNLEKEIIKKYSPIKRWVAKKLIKRLDGGICVGKYEEDLLKKITHIPSRNVSAFVSKKEFYKTKIPLKSKNMLFVGWGPDYYYKGLDFLIETFKELNKEIKDSKLYIVGGGWENFRKKIDNKNISFVGKKNAREITGIAKKCSLMCHFGRGDTFPVTTIEIMNMGIPCIVSDSTGTKEIVEKVSEDYIISMKNKKESANKIIKYLNKSEKEKKKLGERFRRSASFYNEKNCINLFKENFYGLIKEIEEKNESFDDKSPYKAG